MTQQVDRAGSGETLPSVERRGDRELGVTRTFDAPAHLVYQAWSQSALFRRWWLPKTMTDLELISCAMDVRTAGKYELVFRASGSETMAFYGTYIEVVPNRRIVWSNDEGVEGAVTTVTFEEIGERTRLTFHEIFPSRAALEEELQGSAAALPQQLDQLDQMLSSIARSGDVE